MAYIGVSPNAGTVATQIITSANGSATSFTLDQTVPDGQSIIVLVGNVVQQPTHNGITGAYSASGNTITFTGPPANGDNIIIRYLGRSVDTSTSYKKVIRYRYVATNAQTTFTGADSNGLTLSYTADDIDVFLNGVRLDQTDYTATNGTSVVLGSGATTSDELVVLAYNTVQLADTVPASTGGTFTGATTHNGGVTTTTLTASGNITGTLATASQSNITSVGTLTGLTTSGAIDVQGNEIILDDDGDTSITADTDDQIDLKVGGTDTVVVKPDVVEIKGSHPDLKLMDTDDNNYGGLFYNNGSMTLATDHDATGATGVIKFAIDSTERVAINNNGQLQFKTSANDRTALYFMDPDNSNYGVCGFERATYNGGTNIWYTQNSTHFAIKTSSVIGFFMKHDTRQVVLSRNGSTSPFNTTAQLTVNPDYNASKGGIAINTYAYYSGIPGITIYNNDTNNGRNMEDVLFRRNSATKGYIRIRHNGVDFTSSSDYRLKEDAKEITNAFEQIKKLKPYNFKWKNSDDRQDGFFAHEVGEVFDYVAQGEKDATEVKKKVVRNKEGFAIADNVEKEDWEKGKLDSDNEEASPKGETTYPSDSTWQEEYEDIKPQTIDNSKLVPMLTACLQEAIAKIETLESKVKALEET